MENKIWTYQEFEDSMTAEEKAGWIYEGVRLSDLYKEYLDFQQEKPYFPEWAQYNN